jgi:hypothetical protein
VRVELTMEEAAVIGRALDEYLELRPTEVERWANLAYMFAPDELTQKAVRRMLAEDDE